MAGHISENTLETLPYTIKIRHLQIFPLFHIYLNAEGRKTQHIGPWVSNSSLNKLLLSAFADASYINLFH